MTDKKCLWKLMQEYDSTTFKDVFNETHPLYKCLECSGINGCEHYRRLDSLELLEGRENE